MKAFSLGRYSGILSITINFYRHLTGNYLNPISLSNVLIADLLFFSLKTNIADQNIQKWVEIDAIKA